MKHLMRHVPTDARGRIILGLVKGGCPHCGAIREYESADGRAVFRVIPTDCCPEQAAKRRDDQAATARPPHRRDVDG